MKKIICLLILTSVLLGCADASADLDPLAVSVGYGWRF